MMVSKRSRSASVQWLGQRAPISWYFLMNSRSVWAQLGESNGRGVFYDLRPGEVALELGLLAVHVCDDVLLDEDEHGKGQKAHTVGLLVEFVGKVLVIDGLEDG